MRQADYEVELRKAEKALAKIEPLFAAHLKLRGGSKIKLRKNGYVVLCHSIISQQISGKAAKSISRKVIDFCGGRTFKAEMIVNAGEDQLRPCGLSRGKVKYLKALSQKVIDDPRFFKRMPKQADEAIMAELLPLPGIGPWTVEMFLMFSLGRLDVLPVADLGVQNGMKKLFGLSDRPKKQQMFELAEPWKPYRSVASLMLWACQEPGEWP